MTLDRKTITCIYEEWVARQPLDAPTFGGPAGNQFFSDDEEYWQMIEAEERRRLPNSG